MYKINKEKIVIILRDKLTVANGELETVRKRVEKLEIQLDYLKVRWKIMVRIESKEIRFLDARDSNEGFVCEVRLKQDDRTKKFYLREIKIESSGMSRTEPESYEILEKIHTFFLKIDSELHDLNKREANPWK